MPFFYDFAAAAAADPPQNKKWLNFRVPHIKRSLCTKLQPNRINFTMATTQPPKITHKSPPLWYLVHYIVSYIIGQLQILCNLLLKNLKTTFEVRYICIVYTHYLYHVTVKQWKLRFEVENISKKTDQSDIAFWS